MLSEGCPDDGVDTNMTLKGGLNKVSSFIQYMDSTWKGMADHTQFEPKFEDVVSMEQLNAVLEFIDADRSGTLELEELSHAFRVSRRFNVDKMLKDGAVIALRQILPNLRAKGHSLKDLLHR
jgi:hypothetical protein